MNSPIFNDKEWMSSRENIIPLKGGRSMKILNSVLSNSITIKEAEKKFEFIFEESKKNKDPLSIIWDYIKWFENIFPTGKQKTLFPMLWRSVNFYSNSHEYENDERLIKLWIKLCDNYPTRSLAIFECAFTKGVGRYSALFYISWSEVYEVWGSERKARETLKMGLKYGATPISLINKAIDNFEMRCIKKSLDKNNFNDDDSDMDTDNQEEEIFDPEPIRRSILGNLSKNVTTNMIKKEKNNDNNKENNRNYIEKFNVYHDNKNCDNLDDDLEYQELFGYFEKIKTTKVISIKENENRGIRKGEIQKLEVGKQSNIQEFEVFCDDDINEVIVSEKLEPKLKEQKVSKTISRRMCKKIFLKEEISVVENFLINFSII
ncbi:Mitotic checkpoint serine/threonine-protein kinase BUB1 beta [Strongyloides ratti]|uniref:Mitotic checkpoint serine/threonine-protein kinase BUB1 beta n=1 Tax=Strongyloides ratti TaxID=34506 RepID=A0A090KW89_STRRB|nr:Mitotic checkpoint serine/threonine-protein kinase BUB1 beta [Strongyloides ratti]CEF61745.1 Mitotic checkpoint serine/threonine-protein kinase BUB1 beta [Strongyloides ratti]